MWLWNQLMSSMNRFAVIITNILVYQWSVATRNRLAAHFVAVVVMWTGDWQHWSEKVPEYIYPSDSIPEFATILVPNVDNTRTNFLMDTIAKQQKVKQILPTIDHPPTHRTAHWTGLSSRTSYHPALCFSSSVIFLLVDVCVGLNWLLVSFFYHTLIKTSFIHSLTHSFIHSFKVT